MLRMSKSEARRSCRKKNHGQRWTREVWPRCRWSLRTPARWSSRRSCQCGLTSARLRERGGRRGRGRRGGALGGLAWPEMRWCGRESSPKHGGARRGDGGAKCGALEGRMAGLRRPSGAWRLVGDAGADRRGHRWCTANRWPDTRRRVSSVQTETFS